MDLASDQLGTAARRRGADDRRDRLADDLLPVRQRQPGDLRGHVEPRLRRGGALRPRLRRHPRARRRGRRAGSRRDPDALPRDAVAGPRRRSVTSPGPRRRSPAAVCEGATVQLEYPSDLTVNGLAFGPIAERIVANLDEVGISVELRPGTGRHDAGELPRRQRADGPVAVEPGLSRTRRTTWCSDPVRSSACAPAGPRARPRRSRRCRRRRRPPSTTPSARRCSSSSSRCSTSRARSSRCSSRPPRSSRSPIGSPAQRSTRRSCSTCGSLAPAA